MQRNGTVRENRLHVGYKLDTSTFYRYLQAVFYKTELPAETTGSML